MNQSQNNILEQAAILLGEHFDHFQILVTWNEQSRTYFEHLGGGNWHARKAICREFLELDQARTLAHEINNDECIIFEGEDPPEDSDGWKESA